MESIIFPIFRSKEVSSENWKKSLAQGDLEVLITAEMVYFNS